MIFTKEKFQIATNIVLAVLSVILIITFITIALGFIDTEVAKGLTVLHMLLAPIIAILSTYNYIVFRNNINVVHKFRKLVNITFIISIFPITMELIMFGVFGF